VVKLLTAQQVAEQLQVPTTWIYSAARRGDLPAVRLGHYVRFHPDDLEAWQRRQRQGSVRTP
jgi:excisionase family DNA binding protein